MVEHPSIQQKNAQKQLIEQYKGSQKRSHELFMSYGNAVYIYHREALDWINEEIFHEFIDSTRKNVDLTIANHFEKEGFHKMQTALPFTRYVNEMRDKGQDEFVKNLMGENDYNEYLELLSN